MPQTNPQLFGMKDSPMQLQNKTSQQSNWDRFFEDSGDSSGEDKNSGDDRFALDSDDRFAGVQDDRFAAEDQFAGVQDDRFAADDQYDQSYSYQDDQIYSFQDQQPQQQQFSYQEPCLSLSRHSSHNSHNPPQPFGYQDPNLSLSRNNSYCPPNPTQDNNAYLPQTNQSQGYYDYSNYNNDWNNTCTNQQQYLPQANAYEQKMAPVYEQPNEYYQNGYFENNYSYGYYNNNGEGVQQGQYSDGYSYNCYYQDGYYANGDGYAYMQSPANGEGYSNQRDGYGNQQDVNQMGSEYNYNFNI